MMGLIWGILGVGWFGDIRVEWPGTIWPFGSRALERDLPEIQLGCYQCQGGSGRHGKGAATLEGSTGL